MAHTSRHAAGGGKRPGRRRRARSAKKRILTVAAALLLSGVFLSGIFFMPEEAGEEVLQTQSPLQSALPEETALPQETAAPEETEPPADGPYDFSKPVPQSEAVDRSYFDDAVFIGDSRTEGLITNTGLYNATSFIHKGMAVDTVFTTLLAERNGVWVSALEALKDMSFSKVYVMFGINEAGWVDSGIFIERYGKVIDAIREANSEAIIYVQGIIPVAESVSSTHAYIKNEKLQEYNRLLLELAEEKQVYYIDTGAAFAGEDEPLPEDAATDGIHLKREYCDIWLEYLENHVVTA